MKFINSLEDKRVIVATCEIAVGSPSSWGHVAYSILGIQDEGLQLKMLRRSVSDCGDIRWLWT